MQFSQTNNNQGDVINATSGAFADGGMIFPDAKAFSGLSERVLLDLMDSGVLISSVVSGHTVISKKSLIQILGSNIARKNPA
jgi:hypothetical protein